MHVEEMPRHECLAVVAKSQIGFLACASDNLPYVVPIHYVFDAETIYCFTMPGRKSEWLQRNPNACVLVEQIESDYQWQSVLVRGIFSDFTGDPRFEEERLHAWSLLQKRPQWWVPGSFSPEADEPGQAAPHAPIFFRISIDEISGRRAVQSHIRSVKHH